MRASLAIVLLFAATATVADPGDSARLEVCRDKLKKAHKFELLYDLKVEPGRSPRVLVGPTYYGITFDAKEGFAETLNCVFMGGAKGKCINFELRDYRSGEVVHHFKDCRLRTK